MGKRQKEEIRGTIALPIAVPIAPVIAPPAREEEVPP
jgi:hypothetical protein